MYTNGSSYTSGEGPTGINFPSSNFKRWLFKLDVDDDIWKDIGLNDDSNGLPPAWLADEKVHLGIKSLLELRHCEEEENHLLKERKVLVEWFSEEWNQLQKAKQYAGKKFHYIGVHI